MFRLMIVVIAAVMAMSLHAVEKFFEMDRAGFLVCSNRFSLATFSRATLSVEELNGKLRLPCRITFVPGVGGGKCQEISFASTSTELNKKEERQLECASGKVATGKISPMPKLLQIGSLELEVEDALVDAIIVAKQCGVGAESRDRVLYKMAPENYFRYLCSNESGIDYWWVRMVGKRIEHWIRPVGCVGDEYVVDNDIKSKYFSRLLLAYVRCGDDFRLKKIILLGDHLYQGGPLKSDPASLEVRGSFEKSESTIIENQADGIVEIGCGILRSQSKVKYTVYDQKANGRFKVVIEVCETT